MKKLILTLLVAAIFTVAYAGKAWAPDIGIIDLDLICTSTPTLISDTATDFSATKYKATSMVWRIGLVGKMASDKNCSDYYSYDSSTNKSTFDGKIYDGATLKTTLQLMCACGTGGATGQWFICMAPIADMSLPSAAKIKLAINKGGQCDNSDFIDVKLDANNNFIPDTSTNDYDGDGVLDSEDHCPLQAGSASNNGCPAAETPTDTDTDNDGVADASDLCASTPTGATVNSVGCPDTDSDGAYDNLDECADTPSGTTVDEKGCPVEEEEADTDGDGITDDVDNCPSTSNADQADADGDGTGDACETSAATTTTTTTTPTSNVSEGGMCTMLPAAAFNPVGAAFIFAAMAMIVRRRIK